MMPAPTSPSSAPVVAPRRPGRGSETSPAERREICLARLAEGLTQAELSRKFNRNRDTISSILASDTFKQLEADLDAETLAEARQVLKAHRVSAAQAWARAVGVAGGKGDHRPSRDLLLHTGTIDPVAGESVPHVQVLVGINLPGLPPASVIDYATPEPITVGERQRIPDAVGPLPTT